MIDDFNTDQWPDQVRLALRQFKQGDVIERPPCFYAADTRYPVWGRTPADGDGPEVLEIADEPQFPFGIILTQTCDLYEQAQTPKQPWIQVSPVYAWDDLAPDKQRMVQQYRVGYLVHLTGDVFSNAFWVADLRLQMSLEKSVLAHRDPISAFRTEHEYIRFGEHLARRFGRPALSNDVIATVTNPLNRRIQSLSRSVRSLLGESVVELRLETTPSRLEAASCRLLVITRRRPLPLEVRGLLDSWWEEQQVATSEKGIALLKNKYIPRGRLTDAEYRRSAELDFRYLSPD